MFFLGVFSHRVAGHRDPSHDTPPLFEINIRHVLIWTGLGAMGLDKKLSTYGWVYKEQEDRIVCGVFASFRLALVPIWLGPWKRKIGNQSLGATGCIRDGGVQIPVLGVLSVHWVLQSSYRPMQRTYIH